MATSRPPAPSFETALKYLSTRGDAPKLSFDDALLQGLGPDGGLYVPESYPSFAADEIAGLAGLPYAEAARRVITPFLGGATGGDGLADMLVAAYAGFEHPAVTPLVQIGDNLFVLELFHGPTLAFKDVAMQLLGRMMDEALRRRGERATIVVATSGDTGAAAIEAFRGRDQIDVFVLYPHGRVSDVQRRQMTTVAAENIHVIAVEGTFDDCQTMLKGMFAHQALRTRLKLSAVNSINWARIVAQVVYYFVAAVALGGPHREISFAVPTGNFGDVLAGYVAKRMGLPVGRLMIATNSNDILVRALANGAYELQPVHATQSPSMDIQVSSNFERLLFEASGRDSAAILRHMENLRQSGRFQLAPHELAAIRADFDAGSVDEDSTTREIGRTLAEAGYLADPHTAVGLHVGRHGLARAPATPMVVLGTAHPAKFGAAVLRATGQLPTLPARLAGIMELPERFSILPSDARTIEDFIAARARAGTAAGASA